MDNIRKFNGDRATKKDLLEFIIAYFEERILDTAYNGGDVKSLANAVVEVKKAFEQLDIDYAIPQEETKPTNQAR